MMTETNIKNIVQQYSPLVKSICFKMTWDHAISEDAYQETWLEIIKNVHLFNNESKLSTWIYKVAFRTILRHIKREKTYSKRVIRDFIALQKEEINLADEFKHERNVKATCNRCLIGFLYCLSKDDRFLYILRDIGELDYKIIAEIVDGTPTNLRQRAARIRKRLNNFIKNECFLYDPNANCRCRQRNSVKELKLDEEFGKMRLEMRSMNIYQMADSILPTIEEFRNKIDLLSQCSPKMH